MSKKTEVPESISNDINRISAGSEITGEINAPGDIRIDGHVHGNVISTGRVVIGEKGKIKGEMVCKNADVHGICEGKITVHELLTLRSTSSFVGNIYTKKIAIEIGAKFNGSCAMGMTEGAQQQFLIQPTANNAPPPPRPSIPPRQRMEMPPPPSMGSNPNIGTTPQTAPLPKIKTTEN